MRRVRTVLLALVGALGLFLALSASAFAHVTVTAPGATSGGGDQEITFRVPVEENSNTTGVTIQLPTATPIASVDVAPIAGWTHTQQTTTLATPIKTDDGDITEAVSQITWTAAKGGGLQPGEYGDFTIIAGQLPDTTSLTFKAIQTYANGSVVRWIETQAPGSTAEPEHPAPVLQLSAATTDTDGGTASGSPSVTASAQAAGGQSSSGSSNTGPVVLSIIALVVAAGALGLAVVSRAKGRDAA